VIHRRPLRSIAGALLSCALVVGCGDGEDAPSSPSAVEDPDEALSGGRATVSDVSRMAYGQPIPGLDAEHDTQFFVGNAIFNRGWVTAPASVTDFDGLGPVFNADNCSTCHLKDGRGRPPEAEGERFSTMLLRLSIPGQDETGAPLGDPTYGGQLQGSAVLGVPAEGRETVTYVEEPGTFDDGAPFSLRRPKYAIEDLAHGPLSPDVMISPRVAPAVFGLGLLAAIPEETLERLADADDRDGDGISGRINHVWDVRKGSPSIGRFGWKANQPSLEQQSAGAFLGDMGITSSLFPGGECSAADLACAARPNGADDDGVELRDGHLRSVVSYLHTLAVPARRHVTDATVKRGKEVFLASGCGGCHVPRLDTGDLEGFPELSRQTIRPYTDLLLHDMGPDLADGRPDFEASGSEWRTPPLWGLGLLPVVNRHGDLLHDGRARDPMEAILWHGGEASASKRAVLALSADARAALLAFLGSL
jgi:CxxC motif-containing protein (DUF1111 family)